METEACGEVSTSERLSVKLCGKCCDVSGTVVCRYLLCNDVKLVAQKVKIELPAGSGRDGCAWDTSALTGIGKEL